VVIVIWGYLELGCARPKSRLIYSPLSSTRTAKSQEPAAYNAFPSAGDALSFLSFTVVLPKR